MVVVDTFLSRIPIVTTPYVIRDNPRIKGTKILASLILKAYQLTQKGTLLYSS